MTDDIQGAIPTNPATSPEPTGADATQTLKQEDVDKLMRSFDKSRTEFHKTVEALKKENEDLKKSTMSESELRKLKEEQLRAKEKELMQKEVALIATDSLKDNGLPLEAREFVLADSPEQTKDRILRFKEMWQKVIQQGVQEKFKSSGHEPAKGTAPVSPTFTREQLKTMSREEIQKNLPELVEAMKQNRIK